MKHTLTYSDNSKGWTSFHSFIPDWMCKLNNRFFSIKNGQLYLHNDETNPVRNNFYGEQFTSKIETVINEANSEDKIFKTMVLEGNKPWDVSIETNIAKSTIAKAEFNQRESRHFAYVRKNEDQTDLHGHTAQGIGVVVSTVGLTVTFATPPNLVNVTDQLFQLNAGVQELIGTITDITGNVVTVNAITTTPVPGYFSFATKNARVEGSEIRGYYALVTLENDDTAPVELFAINSNAVKSFI
jgi:hypothetical protein